MSTSSSPVRPLTRADFANVTNIERGENIKQRRLGLHIRSYRAFERATRSGGARGLDRGTLQRAEEGDASAETYDFLENWLDRQELENGHTADPEPAGETIQLTIRGVYGVDEMTVTGPVEHPEALAETVARMLDELRKRND